MHYFWYSPQTHSGHTVITNISWLGCGWCVCMKTSLIRKLSLYSLPTWRCFTYISDGRPQKGQVICPYCIARKIGLGGRFGVWLGASWHSYLFVTHWEVLCEMISSPDWPLTLHSWEWPWISESPVSTSQGSKAYASMPSLFHGRDCARVSCMLGEYFNNYVLS